MRSCAWLVVGILVGSATQCAPAQQRHPLIALNHVAFRVPNLDEAVDFYTKTLGLQRAFEYPATDKKNRAVYLQINRDSFLELIQATADRPSGFNHLGFEVESIDRAMTTLSGAGLEKRSSWIAQARDPNGNGMEFLELGPDTEQRKAMDAWR